jgi:hypothetical protein
MASAVCNYYYLGCHGKDKGGQEKRECLLMADWQERASLDRYLDRECYCQDPQRWVQRLQPPL